MAGLMRKQKPQGANYDSQHHHHHHNHHIFICRTPIVCNHGDNQSETGPLALKVCAVSGSVAVAFKLILYTAM
ncbi:Hypothetical predicted protein [Scomber scombrus]|uniref:Uncharacterized protein n=1 Tax=Scomber scombrus TaxID=13677 RepID=A0AAV1N0H0_SCOSC